MEKYIKNHKRRRKQWTIWLGNVIFGAFKWIQNKESKQTTQQFRMNGEVQVEIAK